MNYLPIPSLSPLKTAYAGETFIGFTGELSTTAIAVYTAYRSYLGTYPTYEEATAALIAAYRASQRAYRSSL